MPGFVEPCDPTLHERAPTGPGRVYEIKTDGYRAQVQVRAGEVTIYSRSGYDWTEQFAAITGAATLIALASVSLLAVAMPASAQEYGRDRDHGWRDHDSRRHHRSGITMGRGQSVCTGLRCEDHEDPSTEWNGSDPSRSKLRPLMRVVCVTQEGPELGAFLLV
jgi:hypothetical protein